MKKGFIALLILLLCAWVQSAYGAAGDVASINGKAITAVASVAGKANAAILTIGGKPCSDGDAACGTSAYTGAAAADTTTTNLQYAYGAAVEFQATGTDSPCKIDLTLSCSTTNCTDSGNFTAYIWTSTTPTETSGLPSSEHSASAAVGGVNITSSATSISFTIASPSALTNGNYYFVGFLRQTIDSTDYPIWSTGGYAAAEVMVQYTSTPEWTDLLTRDGTYAIYK